MNAITYAARLAVLILVAVPWFFASALVATVNRPAESRMGFAANRFALRLFGVTVSVENRNPPDRELAGCVFVLLNQTSLLDGTLGSVTVPPPFRAVTNIEYALFPVIGWASAAFAWVVVRQWPAQARRVFGKMGAFLDEGGNIYVSIEGQRSKDGGLCAYKKGPAVLAIRNRAPLIPVYINGARDCMPPGSWTVRPGHVRVCFLPEIGTEGLTYEDRDMVVERLRATAERELAAVVSTPERS